MEIIKGNRLDLTFTLLFVAVLLNNNCSCVSSTINTTPKSTNTSSSGSATLPSYSTEKNSFNSFSTTEHSVMDNTTDYVDTATIANAEEKNDKDYNNDNGYKFDPNSAYDYDYGEEYMYPGYSFERPVYLYIWEILVIVTFLVNIIVISVLLRRKLRNATNMILASIAISDTLTGLVTLPTYIMVYQNFDPLQYYYYDDHNFDNRTLNESTVSASYVDTHDKFSFNDFSPAALLDPNQNKTYVSSNSMLNGTTEIYSDGTNHFIPSATQAPVDGYILTKDLCRGFMISKFFLSKSFHTVSILLTLFLGIQRYVSVAFPFRSQSIFTVNKTIIFCAIIFVISPALHLYHLTTDKAVGGLCQWDLGEERCGVDCIYLWILFFIRHFIPCVALTVFTCLFIKHLRLGTTNLRRMDSNASQISKRKQENRRISMIVTAIVVVFLIPEIPYGIFLLYSALEKAISHGKPTDLARNRAIHMAYELLLVVSFNANFYIYTFLNKKFRKCLYRSYIKPLQALAGDARRLSITRTSSTFRRDTRKTSFGTSQGGMEMKAMQTSSSDKSVTMETKLKQSLAPESSQNCSNSDSNEHSALNANV